jgi:hypothetical protein
MPSPILDAELRYQRRIGAGIQRRWLHRMSALVLIAGLIVSIVLFGLELWSAKVSVDVINLPLLFRHDTLQLVILNLLPLILLPLSLIVHFGLLLRTLMFSSGVVRREQLGGTWQLLALTNQSPTRIIVSKWAATLVHLAPSYLLLALLRVCVIVFVGLELFRFDNFYVDRNSVQFFFAILPLNFALHPDALVVGALLIILLTFINLLFTAALGVLISTVRRGGHLGDQVAIAFVLRTMLLVLPALFLIAQTSSMNYYPAASTNTLGFSLLDNGTLVAAAFMTAPRHQLNFVVGPTYSQFFPADTLGYLFGFYLLITLLSLAAAIRFARRNID